MSKLNTRVLKHQGKSRAWVERIVCDHGVFVKSPTSVQALSVACSREYGGTPEMWVKLKASAAFSVLLVKSSLNTLFSGGQKISW